ncbi:MAG: hypothetical protein C4291_05825 [Candidatus Dadabacteria bacterium]
MNWLDIGISIVVVLFALMGLRDGLVKEVVSIVALGGSIIAGVMFYHYAGDLFIQYSLVKSRAIASAGGFIVVMFVAYVVVKLIGHVLSGVIGALHLGWLDKMGGGTFGAVKGVIIVFLIISAVGLFFRENGPLFRNSVLLPYINEAFSDIKKTIPRDFEKRVEAAKKLIEKNGLKPAIEEVEKAKETIKQIDKKKESKK